MKSIFSYLLLSLLLSVCATNAVLAKEGGFYGVVSGGYATNDLDGDSLDEVSYKLGVGYEIAKQWSIEAGFQSLGENKLSMNELSLDNASQEVTATYIAALGRAANRHGELFYRLGLLRADVSSDYLSEGPECNQGGNILGQQDNILLCQFSESKIAGVIGIGFDFYIHHSSLLRLEIEHIQGQDGFSTQAIYLGFRLNF